MLIDDRLDIEETFAMLTILAIEAMLTTPGIDVSPAIDVNGLMDGGTAERAN